MSRKAVRLIIEGRVQGVGYRWWTVREASRLGLDGWVRNRAEGTVELLAIGEEGKIDRLIKACERGPSGAIVTFIDRKDAEDDGTQGFDQKPTVKGS
jgi:acylphosphatase